MKLDLAHIFVTPGSQSKESLDAAAILARALSDFGFKAGFEIERGHVIAGIWFVMLVGRSPVREFQRFNGVHRIVRKSPFDDLNRRHTSFVGVHVHTLEHRMDQIITYVADPYSAVKNLKTGAVIDDELGMLRRLAPRKK